MHVLAHFLFLLLSPCFYLFASSSLGIPPTESASTNPCCRRRRSSISAYTAAPATDNTTTKPELHPPAAENDFNLHQDHPSIQLPLQMRSRHHTISYVSHTLIHTLTSPAYSWPIN
ncbi:hypothetical protein LY76DRAFT_429303 [Colletotrichum caudatum]|nr:hypothetical protein LY76DRAFT_429303 [Colletotrichum caudatum]